jgi:SAM-dependent methyltransferase
MSRFEELRKFASPQQKGIEIGPWCNPVTPKSEGFDCLVLDVFDTKTLVRRAIEDDGLPDEIVTRIEGVDLVGSSAEIAELVDAHGQTGKIEYIISSHNFEHIPDPVKFLRGCSAALAEGGHLSMAIPDKRGCFDYFRSSTTLAQMLEAYFQKRVRPTRAQIFERFSLHSKCQFNGQELIGFPIGVDPDSVHPYESLEYAFNDWADFEQRPHADYVDTHCWTFTPASFNLILTDLMHLGLVSLELVDVAEGGENEFYVHLRKVSAQAAQQSHNEFYAKRELIMRRMLDESSPTLAAKVASAEARIRSLQHDLDQLRGTAASHSDAAQESSIQFERLRERLDQSQAARAKAESDISALLDSTSWRMTSPVRALGRLLQRRRSPA